MSTKDKFLDPEGIYFVSFATVGFVDVFTRIEIKNKVWHKSKTCTSLGHYPIFEKDQG
jgi:hypothetical protein